MSYYFLGPFWDILPAIHGLVERLENALANGLWLAFEAFMPGFTMLWAQNIYYNAKWYTFLEFLHVCGSLSCSCFPSGCIKLPVSLTNRLDAAVYSFGIYIFHMIVLRFYRKLISAVFRCFTTSLFLAGLSVCCSFPGLWCGLRAEPVPFHGSYLEDFRSRSRAVMMLIMREG